MKMVELKCPYCGADLEVDNGIDSFYCMYCGGKIIFDELDTNTTKLKLKAQEVDLEKYRIDKELEEKERERRHELKKDITDNLSFLIGFAVFVLLIIAVTIVGKYFL